MPRRQTFEKQTNKYTHDMLAVVHVNQQKTGDLMWAEVASLMQLLVPRNGHCLCAKLNLNETKKGVMLDAVWQKANDGGGGGEYWQRGNELMPCQRQGYDST